MSDENSSSGSVSDQNPLNNLIDDLYYLKCSLIKDQGLHNESFSFFQQICNLLEAQPELAKHLFNWKFLENELLYFLRSPNFFLKALQLAECLISFNRSVPQFYLTRKFLFFITEKFYLTLKGNRECKEAKGFNITGLSDFSNINAILSETANNENQLLNSEIQSSQRDFESLFPFSDSQNQNDDNQIDIEAAKIIMKFSASLISINKSVVNILHEFCFFDLANCCIITETAKMFDAVFENISFPYIQKSIESKEYWTQDGIYEIRRKYFDPEVIFRNKEIFTSRTPVENLMAGVYSEIYDLCINIRDFADIAFSSFMNVLLYKRISYSSPDLENLILEGKNAKAFRIYRRSLEAGACPNCSLLNALLKAIDKNIEINKEAVISLYYHIDNIQKSKLLTESRIRSIFECLELQCEHECTNKYQKTLLKEKKHEIKCEETDNVIDNYPHSFDSNLVTTQIFGNTCDNGLYTDPKCQDSDKRLFRSILEDFREFENDHESKETESIKGKVSLVCERKRILGVIKHIYSLVQKELFFKPSYLILMSYSLSHNPDEHSFIIQYFKDFLNFCNLDRRNLAICFLPSIPREIKSKKKDYVLNEEDETPDFYGIKEQIKEQVEIETPASKPHSLGVKLVKNVIESDEE